MDAIALTISELTGISREYGYLIIGVVIGFIVRSVLRFGKPGPVGVDFTQDKSIRDSFGSMSKQSIKTSTFSTGSLNMNGQTMDLDPSVLAEVQNHLRAGNKILAIKTFREATNLGLAESKSVVDGLEKLL